MPSFVLLNQNTTYPILKISEYIAADMKSKHLDVDIS